MAALGGEVGDPDPVRPPGLDARLHGGPGVVDMDVDVPEPVAAHHDQGVAERVEPGAQPVHLLVAGLQEVDHLEGGSPAIHVLGAVERALHESAARRNRNPAHRQPHHGPAVHRSRRLPGPGTRPRTGA
ncbi:hypothetical protein Smic_60490 [Streptomyces microflavus]|uniref:Uncharacterized protein n=1 Tax=Streptomyces microflavus TaxID=1919 RepID=A0A7J0CYF8_STRMI|nr:hypothetical protein Smic_60490 [Streptomyces microflavus]